MKVSEPVDREWARRTGRLAALLFGILGIVAAASLLVLRGGARSLEQRAEEELNHGLASARATVEERLLEAVAGLQVLAAQDLMLRIWDFDADSEIQRALQTTVDGSRTLRALRCTDLEGRVIASTDRADWDQRWPVDELPAPTAPSRVRMRPVDGRIELAVAVRFEGDRSEPLGFLLAELEPRALVEGSGAAITRLTPAGGPHLVEHRPRNSPDGEALPWTSPRLSVRTGSVRLPEGVAGPPWTIAIADHSPALAAEAPLLRRTVLLLTALTAGLVRLSDFRGKPLVLVFARFEAGLFRRLAARARELQELNQHLDRSRAELVKAARLAGMSEVATGILHNVGNALNSVGVSVQQAHGLLTRTRLPKLRKLVGLIQDPEVGLGGALASHPKGPPFLEYLPAVAESLEADHRDTLQELSSLHRGFDRIVELIQSQQEYARHSNFAEPARAEEILEGALVLSNQVLGEDAELRVITEVEVEREVHVHKHKLIEVLVNLINNARQAMACGDHAALLKLGALERGGSLRLTVEDNGVGIPPERLRTIFNHGFSTKDDARGYGLHAAANAAAEMSGSLEAFSDGPGSGATFVLEVPLPPPAPVQADSSADGVGAMAR